MTDMLVRPLRAVPGTLTDRVPVIPVVVLHDVAHAVPVARALRDGGVDMIELTLRTPVALRCLERIATCVPDILVGAGTVVTAENAEDASDVGAQFLVSPGASDALMEAMRGTGLPHLPGAATPSEVVRLLEHGYTEMKFFPAEQSGGAAFLRALAGPLPQVRFCPTGGISPANAADYLALANVGCVGGSWLTPPDAIADGDWARISHLAAESLRLA